MQLIIALLLVIGVALIIYGIARAAAGDDKRQTRDAASRVEVVYRVPSVFDRKHRR